MDRRPFQYTWTIIPHFSAMWEARHLHRQWWENSWDNLKDMNILNWIVSERTPKRNLERVKGFLHIFFGIFEFQDDDE